MSSNSPASGSFFSSLRPYLRLLKYLRHYRILFCVGIFFILLLAIADGALVNFIGPLLNKAFIGRDAHFIRHVPFFLMGIILLRAVANFGGSYCLAWVARGVVLLLRKEIFAKFLRLPASFYDASSSGQLLSLIIYNVDQVASASTNSLITLVQESFFILLLIGSIVKNSWQLSLLFLIVLPLMLIIARAASKRVRLLNMRVQDSMGSVTHTAQEALENYKVIRIFSGESYEMNKFAQLVAKNRFRELKVVVTSMLSSSSVQLIAGSVAVLTIYLATSPFMHLDAGSFTVTITAMVALLKPLRNLSSVNNVIQRGVAAAESIFKFLDEKPEKDKGKLPMTRAIGQLTIENLNFSYTTRANVLNNINLEVEPGQTIALVGRSGSGKTTLMNLLPRFYENYGGRILVDGINTRDIRLHDLRKQFAIVSQQVTLFNDTLAHNVMYGQLEEVSEGQLLKALEVAHVLEFIEQLPQGINTIVGGNGVLLSGGQRQRIAIARALLKNTPFLILDEATSALDSESERYIQLAFDKLVQHKTTLIIAHRLSTVEKADKIIVMDKGEIIEVGTHLKLLEKGGIYANLYTSQFRK